MMNRFQREHTGEILLTESLPFASGQEGEVFRTNRRTVFKRFHRPTEKLYEKLEAMRRCPPIRRYRRVLAWPRAIIVDKSQQFCGYECKCFDSHYELSTAIDVTSRRERFPSWSFRHSVNLALNLALLFDRVHALGVVIGDVNPSNILFNADTTVALVDVDSAQVHCENGVYPCERSTPFTAAPEVVTASQCEGSFERTVYQDAFGLAILVHELLLGWHPFAGSYSPAPGETRRFPPNIEQRIATNLSFYGNLFAADSRSAGPSISQPNYGLSLDELPAYFKVLFHKSFHVGFSQPKRRPLPKRFAFALGCLLERLRANEEHLWHVPFVEMDGQTPAKITRATEGDL